MMRLLGLVILIWIFVVAACGSGDGGDASPVPEVASPTTEPAPGGDTTPTSEPPTEPTDTPEPTETPAPGSDLKIGDPATTANGNTLTVYSYEAPATDVIFDPNPGNVFAAIDVEGCTRPDLEGAVSIGPFDFQLQMPDNTRRDAFSLKEPALHETDLAAGDCVRGFMTFEIPEGVTALFVIFNPRAVLFTPVPIKWAVQ